MDLSSSVVRLTTGWLFVLGPFAVMGTAAVHDTLGEGSQFEFGGSGEGSGKFHQITARGARRTRPCVRVSRLI